MIRSGGSGAALGSGAAYIIMKETKGWQFLPFLFLFCAVSGRYVSSAIRIARVCVE